MATSLRNSGSPLSSLTASQLWNVGLPTTSQGQSHNDYSENQESQANSYGDVYTRMNDAFNSADKKFTSAYEKVNAVLPTSDNYINLTQGKYKGAKVPTTVIDGLLTAAKNQGVDPWTMLALAGQESTFGIGRDSSLVPTDIVSNWDAYSNIRPYNLPRFLADNKVPGVSAIKDNSGQYYGVEDPDKVSSYLSTHPKIESAYYAKLATSGLPQYNAFEDAAARIKAKGVGNYNPNDKNYTKTINDSVNLLKSDKSLADYVNSYNMNRKKMGTGGVATGLASSLPMLISGLDSILTGNGVASSQPIINPITARAMASPYAFGGTVDDLDDDEYQQVQQFATQEGMSMEDALNVINQHMAENQDGNDTENDEDNDDNYDSGLGNDIQEYGSGGWIKKAAASIKRRGTKGKCTPITKPGCTGKARALALTFKKIARNRKKHAMGGQIGGVPSNIEGGEVIQPPGSRAIKVSGPKHEQGGINVNLPQGTKVFSDRLKIDGKSMQERKVAREKRLAAMDKALGKNPTDRIARNTADRTKEVEMMEEQRDMALQETANKLYSVPQHKAMGGRIKYAGGTGNSGTYPGLGINWDDITKNYYGNLDLGAAPTFTPSGIGVDFNPEGYSNTAKQQENLGFTSDIQGADTSPVPITKPAKNPDDTYNPTLGDFIGMAGTVLGPALQIANTNANARATPPVRNRYQGVGERAIDNSRTAEGIAGNQLASTLADVDTDANTSYAGNRGGASSVNTMRALNTATAIGANKAKLAARQGYATNLLRILDEENKNTNLQDIYQAQGASAADTANQANVDALFSNRASNYTGLSNAIETIGKDFNSNKSNQMNLKLLNQLSQFGIGFDKDGNLINVRTT